MNHLMADNSHEISSLISPKIKIDTTIIVICCSFDWQIKVKSMVTHICDEYISNEPALVTYAIGTKVPNLN